MIGAFKWLIAFGLLGLFACLEISPCDLQTRRSQKDKVCCICVFLIFLSDIKI